MARRPYRSDLGIIWDILTVAMEGGYGGAMISSISRKTNLSNDVVALKCKRLTNAGLLESRQCRRNHTFIITAKGMEFFQHLQKFIEIMREIRMRF